MRAASAKVCEFAEVLDCRLAVGGVGLGFGGEGADVDALPLYGYLGSPSLLVSIGSFEPTAGSRETSCRSICPVLLNSGDTKIDDPVIDLVAVNMVDFATWPLTMHPKPSESMEQKTLLVDIDVEVSIPSRPTEAAFDPSLWARREQSCFWIINNDLSQSRLRKRDCGLSSSGHHSPAWLAAWNEIGWKLGAEPSVRGSTYPADAHHTGAHC